MYNQNTHSFFAIGLRLLNILPNGDALAVKYRNAIYHYKGANTYLIPGEYLYDETHWQSFDPDSGYIGIFGDNVGDITNGLITTLSGIYNYRGELIATYPDNWSIDSVDAFSGGYAALCLRGADGNTYITVVDTDGNSQYDPIKVGNATFPAWHGYVSVNIDDEDVILDPQGNRTSRSEIDALSEDYTIDSLSVSCGFETGESSYTDANGNMLSVIYVVGNYDEIAQQSYTIPSTTPAPQVQESAEVDRHISKDYVTLSDFSIEGKWKNVGEYTFGQVQTGSIVSFDGINCNVFSPQDTYAFYKDGDNYKLDCTSFLFADTVSFTVKIVDENNIDLLYDSDVLELTRIN